MSRMHRFELAVRDFLIGGPLPPGTGRTYHLMRALPSGTGRFTRAFREVVLSLDDLKHGLPHIRSVPIRLLVFALAAPALLGNEILIRMIGGRPIVSAPASKALALIKFLVPKKAFDRIFAQAIEDFREEYYLELAEGRVWRARWLHACLYLTLLSTTALWLGTSAAKKAVDLWKIS